MLADLETMMITQRNKGTPEYLHELKYDYGGDSDDKLFAVKITNVIEDNCQ